LALGSQFELELFILPYHIIPAISSIHSFHSLPFSKTKTKAKAVEKEKNDLERIFVHKLFGGCHVLLLLHNVYLLALFLPLAASQSKARVVTATCGLRSGCSGPSPTLTLA